MKGRRIRLRRPVPGDAAALFALFGDADTMRHWPRAPMRAIDEAAAYIAECAEHFEGGARIDWVIAPAHAESDCIGTCTLYDIEAGDGAWIGYALMPAQRGRGLGTEAVETAVAWAMRMLALERIEAYVEPGNVASQRLLVRAGFARIAEDRYMLPAR